jgi:hypothetical protein
MNGREEFAREFYGEEKMEWGVGVACRVLV